MHSTRHLLTTAATGRALQRTKIPPRNPSDTWSSALSACISFIDQQSRNNFIATVNKGIINPPVLGQADGGFASILALHHDLNSPLFRHSNTFDAEEFMDGVGTALENYEEVLTNLESRDFTSMDGGVVDKIIGDENLSEAKDNKDAGSEDLGEDSVVENTMSAKEAAAAMAAEGMGIVAKKVDWKSVAEKSPESLEGQLASMLSEQCFSMLQSDKRRILLQGNKRMNYIKDSGEVQNVALLSARAVEMSPEEDDTKQKPIVDGDEEPMADVSFSDEPEKEYPVIAEMEVLYSVAQDFSATPMMNTENDEENADKRNQTISSVWVGVFEGWIRNDESDALRWKLVNNRPALEFPGLGLHHT